MSIPFDYDTLRLIWWLLVGILLIGFALTDGFDLGVGSMLPWVAKTDEERRMVINTIAPTWEGNQVWFIVGGATLFAAWPLVYAVSFSGLYLAMFLVLSALILRPVAFKYRSKRPDAAWRSRWDWALFIGSFVPALVFGVAMGNVLLGIPFRLDSDLRSFYDGTLVGLFTPFALLAGALSAAMLVVHGAGWLSLKAEEGPVIDRARRYGQVAAIIAIILFAAGGLMVAFGDIGYRIDGVVAANGPSNPHLHGAVRAAGGWMHNYAIYPWMVIAPIMGFVGLVAAIIGIRGGKNTFIFAGSSLANIGIISTAGLSMYPFILPSSADPASSLTAWNASSSHGTLFTMLIVTAIFLPLIVIYTSWVYRVLFGRVTIDDVRNNPDYY